MSFADRWEASSMSPYWLRNWQGRYGFALAVIVTATLVQYGLGLVFGLFQPFAVFYFAIILVALLAGLGPSIFATLLSAISVAYFFWESLGLFGASRPRHILGLAILSLIGGGLSGLAGLYRRHEARLQEFHRVVEGLEEMIVVVDREYRYVIANQAFLSYRGMKKEDVIGRQVREILIPGVFENTVKEKMDECLRGKVVQYEMRYNYPGRGESDLFISYFPIAGPGGVDRIACILRDVTERRRAEQGLKLFRELIDHSNDAVEVIDPSTFRFLDANEKAYTELGYTREELLSLTVCDVNPSLAASCTEALDTLRATGSLMMEGVHRRKDGSTFPVELSMKFVRLERSYVVAVARDISERRKAEEILRESEDRYRDLVDHSEDLVCTHDLQGRMLSMNPAAARSLGYEVAELLKIPMRDVVVPEYRGLFDAYLAKMKATGADRGLMVVLSRNGERRTWAYHNTLRTVGVSSPVVRGMAHDITERRRAELARQESENRYQLLFEKSVAGVAILEMGGRVVECNDAWARMFGHSDASECRGGQITDHYPNPADRTALVEELKQSGAYYNRELELRRKDGTPFWVLLNSVLVEEGYSQPMIQSTGFDITERKHAEEALRNSEQRYRLLFEGNMAGVATSNMQGQVLDCNDAWARMLGYAGADEIRGRATSEFYFRMEEREPLLAELMRDGALAAREMQLRRKDGAPVWVLFNCAVLSPNGGAPVIQATTIDVTSRKQAEETLQSREEDYRRFVAQSSEGIFREDPTVPIPIDLPEDEVVSRIRCDSYISECNDALAKMYDFASSREMVGKRLADMLVPGDASNLETMREYVRSGFHVLDRESHEVDQHGNPKVFRNSMIGIVEDGKLVRTWGIQRDVTERVSAEEARNKAEEATRASESHFRILVEQASDGIFIVDSQGNYQDANSAGAEMLGYSREEILQKSVADMVSAEDIPRIGEELGRLESGQTIRSEWKFQRKDGSLFPGEVSGKRLPDGRLQGILRDMTERKRAEEAMRHSEERFRVALKDSPITVFNQDCDLRYTWIYNPHLYWQHECIGKTDADLIGKEKASRLDELKRRVLKKGTALREEVQIPHDGKSNTFDLTIEPLFDAVGKVVGITGASMDIARLRELADNLRDAKDKLAREKSYLESEIQSELGFEEIIGQSPALVEVLKKARVVAPTASSVLLLGETGTGKELVARSVHALSARHDKSFIKLNCAAVPSGLLESELFGHEKGAFTGAVTQKVGRIELADKGTLFLDEIGELPVELQPKLLRVLQDREFERLGGVRTLHVDVRIISATNRDLQQDIVDKKFREDLYYRLNVFPIQLPALRDRRSDIPMLVRHFVHKHALRMGRSIETIPPETLAILQNWNWPGNIRELENVIERMVIMTRDTVLAAPPIELDAPQELADDNFMEMEREHILRVLRETNGVLSGADGAASRLGIKRTTLQSMLKRFGIGPEDYRRRNGTWGAPS